MRFHAERGLTVGAAKEYQPVLDSVYRFRLLEAKSPDEKQKIEQFIAQTTKEI